MQAQSQPVQQPPAFLSTLRNEHRYFQSLLDICRDHIDRLAAGSDTDLDVLEDALRYLAEYPEDYHHPREDLLFDRLRSVDRSSGPILDKLLSGHDTIHTDSNDLHHLVMRLNNGETLDRSLLAAKLARFVDGYETHMRDENEVVFTRAEQELDPEDWENLDAALEHVEDPLFGTRVRRRYRRLAAVLEARLGVARRDLIIAEYLSLGAVVDTMIKLSETGISIGYVAFDRSAKTWRENLATTRKGLASGRVTDAAKLPLKLLHNTLGNIRGGFSDSSKLLRDAVTDIRTPNDMRLDTLKELLRDEWGRREPRKRRSAKQNR